MILASVGWAGTNIITRRDVSKKDFKDRIFNAKRTSYEALTKQRAYYRRKDLMAGPVFNDVNTLAQKGVSQFQLSKKQAYVPNEIIVKFRETAAKKVDEQLSKPISAKDLKVSASIDNLKELHGVKDIKPVFKDFKANQKKLEQLKSKSESQLTKDEKRIVRRMGRALRGAKIPALDRIYKLKVNLKQGQSIEDAVASFSKDPSVEYAQLNRINTLCNVPNDPYYSIQWALNNTSQSYPVSGGGTATGTNGADINAPEAWDIYQGNSDVVVAVIDTGVDYNHEDLQGNIWTDANGNHGYDFVNNDDDPLDDDGHGTHCAGIIAARGNNNLDISGVCWMAKIMAVKFLDSSGSGDDASAVAAIEYAADNGADVLSNSWGPGGRNPSDPIVEDAVDYAYALGCVVVFAAGNSSDDVAYYSPANYSKIISVVATDSSDQIASFSNFGDLATIAAPGVDILSLRATGTDMYADGEHYYPSGDPNATMYISTGTSMACPQVAGACALLLSYNPALSNEEVKRLLVNNADVIFDPNEHICSSNGRLNIGSALAQIPPRSQGHFFVDSAYSCSDTIYIRLEDYDIRSDANVVVNVSTSGGDSEKVVLDNVLRGGVSDGAFTGSISTVSGEPDVNDGVLQVANGDTIYFVYEDANDGTGNPATITGTALVDCEGPVVSNLSVDVSSTLPVVTFNTNEPAQVVVRCETTCGGPNEIEVAGSGMTTNHSIVLRHLSSSTNYFMTVECNDTLGNHRVNNNGGQCYTFTTGAGMTDINVPGDFNTVQAAINHAWDGDTIWLADGIYTGVGNYNIDFGGRYITVRSQNGPENCVIDCQMLGRGFVFVNSEGPNSVLDGLTIKYGYAVSHGVLTIFENFKDSLGGAIYCYGANPSIINCNINNNYAAYWGGGIYAKINDELNISNCTIEENGATWGGGIKIEGEGSINLTGCIISKNTAYGIGGIECAGGRNLNIQNCIITDNTASVESGGIFGVGMDVNISSSVISRNSAERWGGIYLGSCDMSMKNCVISDNYGAEGGGGGFYIGAYKFTNCTFAKNTDGGMICYYDGTETIVDNCIFWGNSAEAIYQTGSDPCVSSILSISYSDIEDGLSGIYVGSGSVLNWDSGSIINSNPLFALESDYHIMGGSPCIDAGTNDPCGGLPKTDFDGNPRSLNGTADIGAYEYNSSSPSIALSTDNLLFYGRENGVNPDSQSFSIRNCGGVILNWQLSENSSWLQVDTSSGSSSGEVDTVTVSVNKSGLSIGTYECELIISGSNAVNSPRKIRVKLRVYGGILHVPGEFPTIQSAIGSALVGDTVLVSDGNYTGNGNRDIKLFGKAITVKSENGPENCIISCQGSESDPHRGFYIFQGEDANSVIEGFTITGGYANDELWAPDIQYVGGGIYCFAANPTIKNCIIEHCFAYSYGGGIAYDSESASVILIENCVIKGNSAKTESGGGAAFNGTSDVESGKCKIRNCVFQGNQAPYGGAIFSFAYGFSEITNTTIIANSSEFNGGGISIYGWRRFEETPKNEFVATNCIFWNDTSVNGPEISLINDSKEYPYTPTELTISFSDVKGGQNGIYVDSNCVLNWGEGNIYADPCFVDSDAKDFHLKSSSALIDSGTPAADISPYDIEGNNRAIDGDYDGLDEPDMGAYEYVPPPSQYPVIAISNHNFIFIAYQGRINPEPQTFLIHNGGAGSIKWEIANGCPWLSIKPTTGDSTLGTTEVVLSVDISGLSRGTYNCQLNIVDKNAVNSPRTFNVTLKIFIKGQLYVPSEYGTIQDAINSASNGDSITISPGLYHENINMLGKNIVLGSSDPNDSNIISSTIIEGDAKSSVVTLDGRENDCQIKGLTIRGGYDPVKGGGIDANGSRASIISCIIRDNYSSRTGGAINNSNGLIDRCIITGNTAEISGGGAANCNGVIRNSLIVRNQSASGGGVSNSDANIINCTIAANTAEKGGGLADCSGSVANCIIWNNISDQLFRTVLPSFSCVEGGSAGTGNIDVYPDFIDQANDNYQLLPWSFCVDSGANEGLNLGAVDLIGTPRTIDGDRDGIATVDMGCYESLQIIAPALKLSAWQIEFSDRDVLRPSLSIRNIGQKKIHWSASVDCDWLAISPDYGTLGNKTVNVELKLNKKKLTWGTYNCTLTISSADALNSPRLVPIICHVTAKRIHVSPETCTIQNAIDHIVENGTIVLADGLYAGQGNFDIDWGTNAFTLRSENGPNNCIIDVNATGIEQKRAFIFKNNQHSGSILEGVTIKNAYSSKGGSAIYCESSNPTIKNCIFMANTASDENGAAILNYMAGSTIMDCIFKNNTAKNGGAVSNEKSNVKIANCAFNSNIAQLGGAVYNDSNTCELIDCIFSDNSSVYGGAIYNYSSDINVSNCGFFHNNATVQSSYNGGGAIYNYSSNPIIEDCNFSGNSAMWDGGAIFNMLSSSPIVKNCLFYDNHALSNDGGAIFNVSESHPVITRCSFINNRAASWGGAMRNQASSPIIFNCLFAGSWAHDNGGAIFNYYISSPQLTNCTFVGNSANGNDGESLYSLSQCSPTVYSCIFWDGFGGTEIECNKAEIFVFYSDIKGGYIGQTNIDADPLFVDPCNPDPNIRNYRLQVISPCINTGDPNYIAEVNDTDLDGQPRIIGVRIDMGAYEFSNQIPVADAGNDQIIYAYIDNIAEVNLDGSRSYSPEGKPLTYLWKWAIYGNSYEANGVNPTIELPVGIHTVELIVNDGLDDSQPDSVDINVVAPLGGRLNIMPSTINRWSYQPYILAVIEIDDIAKSSIKADELLTLYPGEIKATKQWLFTSKDRYGKPQTTIFAFFDKGALTTAVPGNGDKELKVAGKLKSGQYFYGSDIIRVIGKKNGL